MTPCPYIKLDTIFYDVRSGDNLHNIIRKYYGRAGPQRTQQVIQQIMQNNPEITNPNYIYPGQTLVIDIPHQYRDRPISLTPPVVQTDEQMIKALKAHLQQAKPAEKQLISSLAPIMLGAGTTTLGTLKHSFRSNVPLYAEVVTNYDNYKAGKLTKGQYDYQRRKTVKKIEKNMGLIYRLLGGNKSPNQILRIAKAKDKAPTHVIDNEMKRMLRLSKVAANGGVVLSGVGLGVACYNMAQTDDKQRKNEIFVESIGGVIGGGVYGLVISIVFATTPLGWVAALVIGAGAVAASYGGGKFAKGMYTTHLTYVDFSSAPGINTLCR